MTFATACGFWDNGGCTGTPFCPPRCPRFVDKTGDPVLILPLVDDDVDSLVSMYLDFAPEHRSMGLPPVGETAIRDWVGRLHDRGTTFVAWLDGVAVGHAGFVPQPGHEAEFFVYVHQDAHGRGLGTELTRQAIAHAGAAGHDALTLYVARCNRSALAVFRAAGFESSTIQPLSLEMRLPLTAPGALQTQLAPAEA